jgi:hypothetical protein
MKIARIAVAPALALAIAVGGFAADASANAKGDVAAWDCAYGPAEGPAVVITGGTISNTTDINISASAGSATSDASGGSNNIGSTGGGGGISTANVGGGGAANAAANGGAISLGDVNSGANVGNSIVVGDTANCATEPAPAPEPVWEPAAEETMTWEAAPAAVVALPATGVGGFDAGLLSAIAAAGAAGAAGLGLRRR